MLGRREMGAGVQLPDPKVTFSKGLGARRALREEGRGWCGGCWRSRRDHTWGRGGAPRPMKVSSGASPGLSPGSVACLGASLNLHLPFFIRETMITIVPASGRGCEN